MAALLVAAPITIGVPTCTPPPVEEEETPAASSSRSAGRETAWCTTAVTTCDKTTPPLPPPPIDEALAVGAKGKGGAPAGPFGGVATWTLRANAALLLLPLPCCWWC